VPTVGVLYALESLTALNGTEATERGAPLSVFSALSGISGSFIRTLACPEVGVLYPLTASGHRHRRSCTLCGKRDTRAVIVVTPFGLLGYTKSI
jgi:hypothetical protein